MDNRIYLNDGWSFSPDFAPDMVEPGYAGALEQVRLPHTVAVTPFNNFDVRRYEKVSLYRRELEWRPEWEGRRVLLTLEGAAHYSEVYLNGTKLASHPCGYTAFTVELTDALAHGRNVLAIRLDSRESLNQPPFGYVIDYMTYGGIYRDVYLDIKGAIYIEDVFVRTKGTGFETDVALNGADIPAGCTVRQTVAPAAADRAKWAPGASYAADGAAPAGAPVARASAPVSGGTAHTAADAPGASLWSLEQPALYLLATELLDPSGATVDTKVVRFGFRDIRFDESGFYLNGRKVKLRGLNRHQSWPYVGYAMPRGMQREDADILKYELGLNEVRTSHYPQGQHFVDRCDEIGLLVFTEIPGWQHIGGSVWKDIAVQNVRDMVAQYRNHPSVFLWGVRINESLDDDPFYERTNAAARELDPTRPTGGVRYLRRSRLLEDVYTYNDFSHYGANPGLADKKDVTDTRAGYLVTEYNGHMFPTKAFDDEAHRTEHAIRHAAVLDACAADARIAGASGWCAFDYNTHKDFGAGDKICYHGVMDMFRNPKLAAAVYRSQQEPDVAGDVLCVTSGMDIGEYPAGAIGDIWIFTNADSVRFYEDDILIKEFKASDSPFAHLAHGPLLVDDFMGGRLADEDGFSAETAQAIKEFLMILRRYAGNADRLTPQEREFGVRLMRECQVDEARLRALYGKYIAGWGGSSIAYRFEAVRGGRVVAAVVKTPSQEVAVRAEATRTALTDGPSYDAATVRLSAVDSNGNVQPYCQEAVTLRTEGAVRLLGPSVVSLKGGMAGTYVATTGTAGSGTLVVADWLGNEVRVAFTVARR